MSTHLSAVVIDAADPPALARWWAGALGWDVVVDDDGDGIVAPRGAPLEGQVPELVFCPVDDAKVVKNRVHLDLASEDAADQAAIVQRLLAAGATPAEVGQTGEETWEVLADPEGNELCVLLGHHQPGNPLAAICLDAVDPAALAPFWVAATGWEVVDEADEGVSLANPNGHRPHLDVMRVPEAHTVKNRVHLDVAPPPPGSQAAEVSRLEALGAGVADVGQTGDESWVVLRDPEGNELCVLTPRATPHPAD